MDTPMPIVTVLACHHGLGISQKLQIIEKITTKSHIFILLQISNFQWAYNLKNKKLYSSENFLLTIKEDVLSTFLFFVVGFEWRVAPVLNFAAHIMC